MESPIGDDKLRHFAYSAISGFNVGAGLAMAGISPVLAWLTALVFTATAGALKELVADASGRGTQSWWDFAWDVVGAGDGAAIGVLLGAVLRRLFGW